MTGERTFPSQRLATGLYHRSWNRDNSPDLWRSHYWLVAAAYKSAPDAPLNALRARKHFVIDKHVFVQMRRLAF